MDKSVSSSRSSATNNNQNHDTTIVRVAGQGQFKINQSTMAKVNEIDNEIVNMLKKDSDNTKTDESQFRNKLKEMVNLITREGEPLEHKELVVSNIIVPSADDLSIAEAKNMFKGEGIIPEE